MTATASPAATDAQAAVRFHAAWLAHTRQELETPALAVREYIQLLRSNLPGDLSREVAEDLDKLGKYGDRLAQRVREFLERTGQPIEADPDRLAELRRVIRHDLRSVAAYHAGELHLEGLRPKLESMRTVGAGFFLARVAEHALHLMALQGTKPAHA